MAFGAKFEGRHRTCLLDNVSLFEHKSVIKLTMAVFFNCSFARAAVKSYTSDLAVRNQPLTHDGRKKRLERFREQFSFTNAEVTANPQLSSFSTATHCSDRFDQHCARLLSVYDRRWPGRGSAAQELRAQWLEQFKTPSQCQCFLSSTGVLEWFN